MKQLASAILAVAFLTVPANGSNGKLESKLSVSETLPALPFELSFSFRGPADGPAKLALHVRPTVGDPFFANHSGDNLFLPFKHGSRLRGGDSHTIPVGGGLAEGGWLYDSRLWQPGEYHLRLVASDSFYDGDLRDGKGPSDAIWSNEMRLTIKAPQGVDAKGWTAIMEATNKLGLGLVNRRRMSAVARALVEKGPDSIYTPFLLLNMNPSLEEIDEFIAKAQAIDPTSAGTEGLQLHRAQLMFRAATNGPQQPSRPDVKEKWDRAEKQLETLAANAKNWQIRELASVALSERRAQRKQLASAAEDHQLP